ncbi:MAG TPA: cytochrome c [Oleiagrimonas sp.]|nr:cytochrome c [Oleiagrimonas sp.]
MKYLKGMIILIIVVVIAIAAWVWSGSYNIGADSPHWGFTRYAIGQLRERSIESRSADIKVPNLDDPALVAEGAHHYAEMCTGCHLAPGMGDSELRKGLYPRPPNLTHFAPDPAEAFWIIKHGIKMTAMPAWGKTHDDQKIWAMVAYLQKQPHMSVERYRELAGMPAMAPVMTHAATSPATTGSAAQAMSAPMTVTPAAPSSAAAPAKAASTH